jgi:rhodanese-related sulfurtransferase
MTKTLLFLLLLLTPVWAQPNMIPASRVDSLREEKNPFFLDVRSVEEIHKLGTLPDYYNIPLEELEQRLDELPKERLILTA